MAIPQLIALVNASTVLTSAAVEAVIPGMQLWLDRDLVPAWHGYGPWIRERYELVYVPVGKKPPRGSWPIYLNRHSADPGALGWHTAEGTLIYGRVFVGDCQHYGISWTADATHEIGETVVDPEANRTWTMANHKKIDLEVCDPVEADALGLRVGGVLCSNAVLPSYFTAAHPGPWDLGGNLKGPAPSLTPGGYVDVDGSMIEADRIDGLRSRRVLMTRYRRERRRHGVAA